MRIIAAILVLASLAPAVGHAQEDGAAEPDVACVPACRSGYLCHRGACVSACNPPCPAAEVCTPAGECVSRCNPPCAAGQTCSADGECRGGRPAGPGPVEPGAFGQGWARSAGKLGIVTAVVVAALTVVIVVADDEDVGIPVGIVATVIGGVAIPIVAVGGGSARRHGSVPGNPGFRKTGWIFYASSLADAVLLLALAIGGADVPPALAGSVGLLGASSALFFSLDAFESASQARSLAAVSATRGPHPVLARTRDDDGRVVTTIGLGWRF